MSETTSEGEKRGATILCGIGLAAFLLGAMLGFVGLAGLHSSFSVPAGRASTPLITPRSLLALGACLVAGGSVVFLSTMKGVRERPRGRARRAPAPAYAARTIAVPQPQPEVDRANYAARASRPAAPDVH